MRPTSRRTARSQRTRQERARARGALTLLEVVVSTMIVGVMIVAALETLGAATRSGSTGRNLAIALGLADERMTEILNASYSGIDAYHNQTEIFGGDRASWSRRTTIQRVLPADLLQTTTGNVDQQVKRIRVAVDHDGQQLVEQIAVVSNTN